LDETLPVRRLARELGRVFSPAFSAFSIASSSVPLFLSVYPTRSE